MKNFKSFFFLLLFFALAGISVFAQSGGVKGKVRTSKGGAIAGATVTARQNGEDVKSASTDASGKFTLSGLKPGIYNFFFEKNGYSSGVKYSIQIENKIVDLGDRLILTVDQGTQVILKGSVFDQNGFSLSAAKIEILRVNDDGSTKKLDSGYSTQNGEFTFRFPESKAKYRVTASFKGISASKDVEVESAAIYRVALSLNVERSEK